MPVTLNSRKIVILGSPSVGKSSLVEQFVENDHDFSESYSPTIERTFHKTIHFRGVDYPCDLIDTAGQDEFSQLKPQYAIGIHGYVLVYSITSRASFNLIRTIYDNIIDYCGLPKLPAVFVGSKADLYMSRQVDSREGQQLAQRNSGAWIETSALRGENISEVFELCLAEIERANAVPVQLPENGDGKCAIM